MTEHEFLYYSLFCKFSLGIGNIRGIKILSSPDKILNLDMSNQQIQDKVKYELDRAYHSNIRIISYFSKDYPENLRNIYNPPLVLYCQGNLEHQFLFSVIGTRSPSEYGLRVARDFSRQMCYEDVVLVSGFAKGIDFTAHSIAVKSEKPTIAVLGCGIDVDYPKKHSFLKSKIVEYGGAIISEFPLGCPPEARNFPVRNRIISGLSEGVFVVEAHEKSGSLITAKIAIEQGKNVYTIPGSLFHKEYKGNHHLIRIGAVLVENAYQILTEYSQYQYLLEKSKEEILYTEKEDDSNKAIEEYKNISSNIEEQLYKNEAKNSINKQKVKQNNHHKQKKIESEERAVQIQSLNHMELLIYYSLIEKSSLEVIMAKTGASASHVLTTLTVLSFKGLVIEEKGLYYVV